MTLVKAVEGAIEPTAQAHVALRPLSAAGVRIEDGLLHDRQQINRDATLLHGWQELERVGNFENFRIAAGQSAGERRGYVFSDSDVYKWLEAVAWEIAREPSKELEGLARDAIALVASVQEPDGYVNTWCKINDPAWRWTDLEMGHELYCAGHLIQAGIAWDRATGDPSLLQIAQRFADLIDDDFTRGEQDATDGHPEVETALVELYRHTGERRYLELAATLTERRGHKRFSSRFGSDYYQDSVPVRDTRAIHGHAVRALYLLAGVSDISAETGDEELMASALAQWEDMVATKLYLTGGVGSRHTGEAFGDPYELPPDRAYCETCAAIASVMWNWRMLLATGESRYADLMERTLYNGFMSGSSLDGRAFFYVNPLHSRGAHEARMPWNPVACCPPNIMRLIASLHQYLATSDAGGVQLHNYTGATIQAPAPDGETVELRVRTRYPWEGTVEVEVVSGGAGPWTLSLRVPEWATAATLDGEHVAAGGYARVQREWRAGDRVTLALDMAPRLTAPSPRIDAIRGCLAVERGPLVYCVEHTDLPEGVDIADLRLDPAGALGDAAPIDGLPGMPGVTLAGSVDSIDGWSSCEYRDVRDLDGASAPGRAVQLLAIPYFAWANRGAGAMRVWIPDAS